MRHHVDVLGLLHIVWGVFGVLAGVSLAILVAAIAFSRRKAASMVAA